jgi:hypothetical protein
MESYLFIFWSIQKANLKPIEQHAHDGNNNNKDKNQLGD